jgi:hypothetical protein
MHWRPWIVLAAIAAVGWTAAGLLALTLVAHVGWAGLVLIGLGVLLVTSRLAMTEDSPAPLPTVHMLSRQYEDMQPRTPEGRLARLAEQARRRRLLSVVQTFGIALLVLGGGMFLLHQV